MIQAILKLGLITATCWMLQTDTVLGVHDVIKRVPYKNGNDTEFYLIETEMSKVEY